MAFPVYDRATETDQYVLRALLVRACCSAPNFKQCDMQVNRTPHA